MNWDAYNDLWSALSVGDEGVGALQIFLVIIIVLISVMNYIWTVKTRKRGALSTVSGVNTF